MKTRSKEQIEQEMMAFGQAFVAEHYGIDLTIPIEINGRLRRAMGRFVQKGNRYFSKSYKIDIAKNLIEYNDREIVEDVLKHELIHYALFELDIPHRDGDAEFERELRNHRVHSSGMNEGMQIKHYAYTCDCKTMHRTLVKNGHNYLCGKCSGELKYLGEMTPERKVEIV